MYISTRSQELVTPQLSHILGIDKDPKKGGAGGKFTWGKEGEEPEVIDPKDVRNNLTKCIATLHR